MKQASETRTVVPDGPAAAFRFLSRRRFLQMGIGGIGLTVAVGGGLFGLRGCAPPITGLRVLSAQEYRTLRAVARAHIPRGGGFASGAEDFDLARRFDAFLADEPAENVKNLKLAVALVEFGPLVYERRLATFSNLSEEQQASHWELWVYRGSPFQRQVAAAFRKFFALTFYDNERVWGEIGYGGPGLQDSMG
jgi:hypothetical protein